MKNIRIKCFDLRDDLFYQILEDYNDKVVRVEDVNEYLTGYSNKQDIYYDGNYMICLEYIVNSYCDCIVDCTEWKQCRVKPASNTNIPLTQSMDGSKAYKQLMNVLSGYYTEEEIIKQIEFQEQFFKYEIIQCISKYCKYQHNNQHHNKQYCIYSNTYSQSGDGWYSCEGYS